MKLNFQKQYDYADGLFKDVYSFTNTKKFQPLKSIDRDLVEEVFNFAYGMSFGGEGHHRVHRTGGSNRRSNGELFADTFQGKLAEFALWSTFKDNNLDVVRPDTEMYGEGLWDSSDFNFKEKKIAVKSTKSYGQLLLLESEDWNNEGLYIPNLNTGSESYDYFVLIRLEPFTADILLKNRLYFNNTASEEKLKGLISEYEYTFDIPGYMSRRTLIEMIRRNYFIPKGAYLNKIYKKNLIDANNYYIQTGNLKNIKGLIDDLIQL
ncbi:hypothetical protein A8F94_14345 [Bacillus sp. FJAT-27225]|uniref:hypothetical protein n=1 Tax=Bacillus sp. FJAT-27225 TaxID=1743144 RepID=UPI00080C2670|nr:hypothetical protein [Bacillus sp. FJAT-27225]OCA86020.1 hypothetical protein A8F94_14345 [Bacillus sp. FJAT-27225]